MSELTYLTSEIRDGFIESYIGDGSHISQDDARALNAEQFDRWLADTKSKQDEATTDRIIALLEAQIDRDCKISGDMNHVMCGYGYKLIALIKGES